MPLLTLAHLSLLPLLLLSHTGHASSHRTPTLLRLLREGENEGALRNLAPTPLVPRSRLEAVVLASAWSYRAASTDAHPSTSNESDATWSHHIGSPVSRRRVPQADAETLVAEVDRQTFKALEELEESGFGRSVEHDDGTVVFDFELEGADDGALPPAASGTQQWTPPPTGSTSLDSLLAPTPRKASRNTAHTLPSVEQRHSGSSVRPHVVAQWHSAAEGSAAARREAVAASAAASATPATMSGTKLAGADAMHASSVMKKRRRKMKRHKHRKLLRRMAAVRRALKK